MQLTLLKSKIHRATVTGASLDYEGSLTVSTDLAELVGLIPYEKILVSNLNNGERFETYAIFGEEGRGIIELNGAASEATDIYDQRNPLLSAYKTLYRQWELVYSIGAKNRERGFKPALLWSFLCDWQDFRSQASYYPLAD